MNNLSQKMGMVKPQRTRWKSGDVCFMGMYAVPNMSVSFVSYPKDVMDHRLKPAYVHEGAKPFDRRYLLPRVSRLPEKHGQYNHCTTTLHDKFSSS